MILPLIDACPIDKKCTIQASSQWATKEEDSLKLRVSSIFDEAEKSMTAKNLLKERLSKVIEEKRGSDEKIKRIQTIDFKIQQHIRRDKLK